ncbi:MAG: GNAT family N-acetyltransferase [Candidatus Poribacteria bacterium]|nr:GNAT family N-acetyltransferase [Candidatus Poribacteria bacterium]
MSERFRIRPAVESDAAVLLSLIRELAEYERLLHEVSADEEAVRKTLFGENPCAEALIGELDGEPIAFALFFQTYSTFLGKPGLWLEDLYVQPQHRRQGYGGQLLKHVAMTAEKRGCGRFEWTALDWNEPAVNFYLKIGAVPMSDWTTFRLSGDALRDFIRGEDAPPRRRHPQ